MSVLKIRFEPIIISNKPTNELTKQLAHEMYTGVMENFDAEGRPGWKALSKRTIKQRLKQGYGAGPILDRKRGSLGLRGGITEYSTNDTAGVGVHAGIPYAKIQHFGGTIDRGSFSGKVRLRTNKKGELIRQKDYEKLALFAKKNHKLAVDRNFVSKPFKIIIPARPYLILPKESSDKLILVAKNFIENI